MRAQIHSAVLFSLLTVILFNLTGSAQAQLVPVRDINGCILWLDANDIDADGTADSMTSGSKVAVWFDKSGSSNNAEQHDSKKQPIYFSGGLSDKSVLHFDGNDSFANALVKDWSGDNWTLFAVASLDHDSSNNWRGIIGNRFGPGSSNWWTLGTKNNGTSYLEFSPGTGVGTSFVPKNSSARIYSVVKQSTNIHLFINGIETGSFKAENVGGTTNRLRIGQWMGADQGWVGNIAEIIIYDRNLEHNQQDKVESYLSEKWCILFVRNIYTKKTTWSETMLALMEKISDVYGEMGDFESISKVGLEKDIWQEIAKDYPVHSACMTEHSPDKKITKWFDNFDNPKTAGKLIIELDPTLDKEINKLVQDKVSNRKLEWLNLYEKAALNREKFRSAQQQLKSLNLKSLRLAVDDLTKSFPEKYTQGPAYLKQIDKFQKQLPRIRKAIKNCDPDALARLQKIIDIRSRALLENPLIDFDKILLVKRKPLLRDMPGGGWPADTYGLPANWQSNSCLPRNNWDNEIDILNLSRPEFELTAIYKSRAGEFIGDVDLHYDGQKILFSSIGTNGCWQIFEIRTDGSSLRQVTVGDQPDVNNYDACYLPDERIIFTSTAYMAAVPCVNGSSRTSNLYIMNPDGSGIRQLCFDQEHNWCPTVMPDGRVMYLRWEYTDTPHSHDRVLFRMNPDGTGQSEYYGSNSYWPNSIFYARPIQNHPTQFVGIVSGHHGVRRMGEMVLFDTSIARTEAAGAVQRIGQFGKKVISDTNPKYGSTLIDDQLVDASWPKFLHPYPLNEKYFLAACQPSPQSNWGIYLVDIFDNMLLLKEQPGHVLFEPVPVRKTKKPPVIPDKVDLSAKDALVLLSDIYTGPGLKGIPRGTIKSLRLFTYHFLYPDMGGPQAVVGMEGPWDIKRIIGTVPVEQDGSAVFKVPANTPISIQPLDSEGKAIQLMRSWFTAMPGEVISCVGCHERQNMVPPVKQTLAAAKPPSEIKPWYGPQRGFNFEREVQPVLDKYCISCHDGSNNLPNLKERKYITDYHAKPSVFHNGGVDAGHFSVSYTELHRFVRRPGLESDYHILMPMEFHADTTQLVQMLRKGHGNVNLDEQAWDRIITWIDLNAPFHGTWTEIAGKTRVEHYAKRRRELLKLYADIDMDPEAIPVLYQEKIIPVKPKPMVPGNIDKPVCKDWPFDKIEAKSRQAEIGNPLRVFPLGQDNKIEMLYIPGGDFIMGDADGSSDEHPLSKVAVKPFWMGRLEITNELFELFDPAHDSRVEARFSMQFGVRGFYVNGPDQPVVRVSWQQAMNFCDWLSKQTGLKFSLPTEAQWEYACRAGRDSPFFYGDLDTDFSKYANLADEKLREFVCHTYKKQRTPWLNANKYDDWIPKDTRFNDGGFLSDGVGNYKPNPFGLIDMHGNVSEWTRSNYMPYPYEENDGRNNLSQNQDKVVRGGSWRDRPVRARSAFRLAYRPYQPVYNVGFRVICETN